MQKMFQVFFVQQYIVWEVSWRTHAYCMPLLEQESRKIVV